MLGLLALCFLLVPLLELALIVQVSAAFGLGDTLFLLVGASLLGAWLVKREGLGVYRRITAQLAAGRMPGVELVDGLLVLLAGAVLLTPGFLTDALGMALLVPPVRALVRRLVVHRFRHRIQVRTVAGAASDGQGWFGMGPDDHIIDVTPSERGRPDDPSPRSSGR